MSTVTHRSSLLPAIAAGAGALGLIALYLVRRSNIVGDIAKGNVKVRFTTYWPYKAGLSTAERRMEGGVNDRKGRPIITLEQHLSDPARYPYVSVAGDYTIWPYGQRIIVPGFPKAVFRVVDTGGHFFGVNKILRVAGHEPLDIAVDDNKSKDRLKIPATTSIYVPVGDNFDSGRLVAWGKLPDGRTA